jgi:hypothetical protein
MSRIADVLQKAAKERATPGQRGSARDVSGQSALRSFSDVYIPWALDPDSDPVHPYPKNPEVVSNDASVELRRSNDDGRRKRETIGAGHGSGTVAEVLNPAFSRSWQEAVAIIQEIASRLRRGMSVPAPQHLLFDRQGRITFQSLNESGETPVVSLAVLLGWLLRGTDAPQALQDLVRENACAAPGCTTVREFSKALAPFEGQQRSRELSSLARRLQPPPVIKHGATGSRSGKIATALRLLKKP